MNRPAFASFSFKFCSTTLLFCMQDKFLLVKMANQTAGTDGQRTSQMFVANNIDI